MGWKTNEGIDVTSAFQGITTPPRELYDEIHGRGWEVQKVDVNGDGLYEATVKNPYGEKLSKVGPDEATALGHCLVAIMRQETMRFLPRTAAWDHTWEQQLPEIAKAYADAPSYDPKAAGAWKELAEDSVRRAEAINNQINVNFTHDPWPYEDVNEMAKDIRDKQRVTISKANLSHPLWSNDQALAYRTVHDVLGHAAVGGDWGWHGENGATAAHMPLLSPEAQKALFTESIGQAAHNSFYGTLGPQKIVFLDDHLQDVQDKENSAGHGGLHPSQSIVPTGIPAIEAEGDKTSKVANNNWQWGSWGKGFQTPDGGIHTWTTDQDGFPQHEKVADDLGLEGDGMSRYYAPITISPNGQFTRSNYINSYDPADDPEGEYVDDTDEGEDSFEGHHQALRFVEPQTWLQQNMPGGYFGHGPHIAAAEDGKDPNHEWASGVEPLPDNAYLWQKEETGLDPLDHQGLKDMAYKLDPQWFGLQDHEGMPDFASQKQAVVNAFRSALVSPRKTPRWAATHYQHIQHIPAEVSDPLRFTDALDVQREAHNQARGLPIDIHRQEWAPLIDSLSQWIKTANPKLDDTQIREAARRELFHMICEEEERVTADDASGDLHPMHISEAVNKALKKRLTLATKPRVDQKFDYGKDRLFHKAFNTPDPGSYGDYLYSHLKPIAGVGLHAEDLARAAREDVTQNGGKGHHFRSRVADLIPGVGPREISEAWLRLQPHSSQLAVITPSIQEALGYDREKQLPPRDYFKAERQLAAARDAAGYTNVPLGQFGWGLHDNMNYGHGVHKDLSPFKAINPVPYDQIDWSQYPNLPTQDWSEPYWWKSTQPNRDEVAKDFDQAIAINNPAEKIPYRKEADYVAPPPVTGWQLPDTQNARGVLRPYITHPESGKVIEGDPNHSLMQHARNTLGLSTEEIWAMDPEVGRTQWQNQPQNSLTNVSPS